MNPFASVPDLSPSTAALGFEANSHQTTFTMNRPGRLVLFLLSLMFFGLATVGCAQTSPGQDPTPSSQNLELHFIDVGQGDSVFIKAPSGQGVLYDGGRRSQVPLD